MKIASLLCAAMLASSPNLAAHTDSKNAETTRASSYKVAQYLWDEEWSSQKEQEIHPVDEASLMNLAPLDASQMIASAASDRNVEELELSRYLWEFNQPETDGVDPLENQLAQYLWDEEWSSQEEQESRPVDEASLMNLAPLDAGQMIASAASDRNVEELELSRYLWEFNQPETDGVDPLENQLAQYLWDKEWSSQEEQESRPVDEASLMNLAPLDAGQMIASAASDRNVEELELSRYLWEFNQPETDGVDPLENQLAQYLWDEEWSSQEEQESRPVDEASLMNLAPLDAGQMIASAASDRNVEELELSRYLWEFNQPETDGVDPLENQLAQYLWDEEWSSQEEQESRPVDEASLMNLAPLDAGQMIASAASDRNVEELELSRYLWEFNQPETDGVDPLENQLAQYLWDEEWSSQEEQESRPVDEASLMNLAPLDASQMIASAASDRRVEELELSRYLWEFNQPETDGVDPLENQLAQYLWDEEWSSQEEQESRPVDEASLMNLAPLDAGQMIASAASDRNVEELELSRYLWEFNQPETDGVDPLENQLAQYLWDKEWSSQEEQESRPVDEASLMNLAPLDAGRMIASAASDRKVEELELSRYLWEFNQPETDGVDPLENQLAQYLWDEEWSSPRQPIVTLIEDAQVEDSLPSENEHAAA